MKLEYHPGTSLAHRLDVRTKLLAFVVVVALTFMFTSPVVNGALAAVALVIVFTLGVPPRRVLALFAPLGVIIVLIVVFASLSPRPGMAGSDDVLVYLWFNEGLPLTSAGLAWGLTLGLRIVTMVSLTSVLILCTPVNHVVALMRRARVPFPIVFIVMTALRFVPTMQHRSEQILEAQRARGAKIDGGGVIGSIRAYTTIMVPLFSTGIRMSEDLAAAMLSRGYGVTKQPTQLVDLSASWRDMVAVPVILAILAGAIALRVSGALTL